MSQIIPRVHPLSFHPRSSHFLVKYGMIICLKTTRQSRKPTRILIIHVQFSLSFFLFFFFCFGKKKRRKKNNKKKKKMLLINAVMATRMLTALGSTGEGEIPFGSVWWYAYAGVSCFLVLFAGIMSGLTLGLMSIGLVDLEILQRSGTSTEKKQAGNSNSIGVVLSFCFFFFNFLVEYFVIA